ALDGFDHLLMDLDTLLLRPDQKKIENAKKQDERHKGRNEGVVHIHFAISWGSFRWPRRNIDPRPSFATAASLGYGALRARSSPGSRTSWSASRRRLTGPARPAK